MTAKVRDDYTPTVRGNVGQRLQVFCRYLAGIENWASGIGFFFQVLDFFKNFSYLQKSKKKPPGTTFTWHTGVRCVTSPLTPGQNGQNGFFSPKFDEKCLKKSFLKKMAEMKILVFYLILVKNHTFPKIQCNTCNF